MIEYVKDKDYSLNTAHMMYGRLPSGLNLCGVDPVLNAHNLHSVHCCSNPTHSTLSRQNPVHSINQDESGPHAQ